MFAIGAGLGLTLALSLMASIRERIEVADVPAVARRMGLVLVVASLSLDGVHGIRRDGERTMSQTVIAIVLCAGLFALYGLVPAPRVHGPLCGLHRRRAGATKTKEILMTSDLFPRHPTRREFLTVGTGLFVALSMPLALAAPHAPRPTLRPAHGDDRRGAGGASRPAPR